MISNDMTALRKKLFFGGKLKLEERDDDMHEVAVLGRNE
jgi:hypothetical protein